MMGAMRDPWIAIVDDNQMFLHLTARVLAVQGYRAIAYSDAHNAVAELREAKPSLILLDVALGGNLNGWDILEALRRDPDTAGIPVLVISGDAGNLLRTSMPLPARGVDVLQKPFNWESLKAKIEPLMGRAGTA